MGHWLDFNVIFWMFIGRFDIQQPTSWYVDTLQLQTMSLYIVCVALFTFTEVPNVTRLRMWVFLYGLRWNLNAKAVATKFCLHIRCHYGASRTPCIGECHLNSPSKSSYQIGAWVAAMVVSRFRNLMPTWRLRKCKNLDIMYGLL